MSNVKRVYPESKTALIKWIEDHFHEIDQFCVTFLMQDKTIMTIYDSYSYLEALGMTEIQRDTLHELSHNDEFIPKPK